jgi:hypothetical protein
MFELVVAMGQGLPNLLFSCIIKIIQYQQCVPCCARGRRGMFELVVAMGQRLPNLLSSCIITAVYSNQGRALLRQGQAIKALPLLMQILELAGEIKSKVLPVV